ncbi:anti-sigma-factor antagonist [Magnetococcus marinus MC-1]|uniref:Anti-sigma-factor antagonist n=1 Tax=Magnetococcus marinus (strain ATCC BAA-1437 / JCM 17883 / MC-1) TaxID=156889 RepID=A0L5B0_MAGMM|nr:STAS domain-containing protein [Magnetococcus marinus]ABK43153.1 anti-sigma-factor antagonist [Magnetococcus marinus MC-1]
MFELHVEGSSARLQLTGDLTIQQAAELKESCVQAVQSGDSLVLNLSGVTRIDLAGLQILCAMHRALVDEGKSLTLQGEIPKPFKETVHIAGFQGCLSADQTRLWK